MLFEGSNFTYKASEAIFKAQNIALKNGQSQVDSIHLLYSLINQQESIILSLFSKLGVDIENLKRRLERAIRTAPSLTPPSLGGRLYLTQDMAKILERANKEALQMGDEFISVEHLFLAILATDNKANDILKETKFIKSTFGDTLEVANLNYEIAFSGLLDLRGDSRITDPEPEAKFKVIERYSRNLTSLAKTGKLDPIIGRENEIRRVMEILCRRTKNNPILIGEPGVGKTAIVEGLALKIAKGQVPQFLKNKEIISLDLGALIAGTRYRGEFEQRVKALLKEIKKASGKYFVFIDEVHSLVGAGAAEGAVDASNLLKPALSKGELRAIGATTLKDYQKYIEKDPALERRFQPVYVKEPSVQDTISILRGIKEKYEVHHGVKISDEALITAVKLSDRYITDRFLPDKAIDLIDEASSALRLEIESFPAPLEKINQEIQKIEIEREALEKEKKNQKRIKALKRALADLSEKKKALEAKWKMEKELIDKIKELKRKIDEANYQIELAQREADLSKIAQLKYGLIPTFKKNLREAEKKLAKIQRRGRILKEEVTPEEIAKIVSRWTGIPVVKLLTEEVKKLKEMEKILSRRIIGQKEAISAISRAIRRARTGISEEEKPLGIFLFLGPTGVGKTETAKALSEFLFDSEKALVRLDMSEYMEKHSVSKIIGSPPGYVGYEEGGQLTEKIRRRPYSVILLDEIEKAHPEIFNILLQIFEDGRLTDAKGRIVSFKNTLIIMTSNLGSEFIEKSKSIGFKTEKEEVRSFKEKLTEILKEHFRPEFLNRIDEVIIFNHLSPKEIRKIVDLELEKVKRRLLEKEIKVNFSPKIKKMIAKKGYSKEYGARPLKRTIQKFILDPLALKIITGQIQPNDEIFIDWKKEKPLFLTLKRTKGLAKV